jgi:hypothetical protein
MWKCGYRWAITYVAPGGDGAVLALQPDLFSANVHAMPEMRKAAIR